MIETRAVSRKVRRHAPVGLLAAVLFALLLLGQAPEARAVLYAIDFNSPGNLYSVDTITGAATYVATTGVSQTNGIAFDSIGQLYANSNNDRFYRIDKTTGSTSQVGSSEMFIFPLEGDLAYNAAGDNFYGVGGPNSYLYRINKSNGSASVIASLGPGTLDLSGLTFGPGGTLYGIACNNAGATTLITIDPFFGSASTVGPTGTSGSLAGLAYDPISGTMYLAEGPPGTPSASSLYTVNPTTGAATLIGPIGVNSISGLAVLVPEPASAGIVFLATTAFAIGQRRRLRHRSGAEKRNG